MTQMLYDINSAATQLDTSTQRVRELLYAGKLTAVMDGKKIKFPHAELQRYIEKELPAWEPGRK